MLLKWLEHMFHMQGAQVLTLIPHGPLPVVNPGTWTLRVPLDVLPKQQQNDDTLIPRVATTDLVFIM